MCKLVPVLRVIGFVFLVIAIIACAVGFVSPFWIHLPPDDGRGAEATTTMAANRGRVAEATMETTTPVGAVSTTPSPPILGLGEKLFGGLLSNGSYHGLWAKCFQNFSCSCFWQNDFAMEKQFPGTEYCSDRSGQLIWSTN